MVGHHHEVQPTRGIVRGGQNGHHIAMPKPAEMEAIARPWQPYRSAATWYLWRRTDIVTL